MASSSIRVLLVEDNRILREGIAFLLSQYGNMDVFKSDGGENLILDIEKMNPDILLVDTLFQERDIVEEVEAIVEADNDVKVILMDLAPGHTDVVGLIEAGISGFILKDASPEEFTETVRRVALGEKVLPYSLTGSLFNQIIENAIRKGKIKSEDTALLTPREQEIMKLIAEGKRNKEIAESLHITTYTVKTHVHNILEKLTLKTRLQIANYAHRKSGTDSQKE